MVLASPHLKAYKISDVIAAEKKRKDSQDKS